MLFSFDFVAWTDKYMHLFKVRGLKHMKKDEITHKNGDSVSSVLAFG